jgi:DNA-binding beta-propeller fold protein YncE
VRTRVTRLAAAAALFLVALTQSAFGGNQVGGAQLWEARYDGPAADGHDLPNAIAVNRAGTRVYVTGSSADPVNVTDFATVAYVAGTGRRLWVARLGMRFSQATALVVSPDGTRVYASGKVNYDISRDDPGYYGTVAYDADTGTQLWYSQFAGDPNNVADHVALSPDGSRLYVTAPNPIGRYERYVTVAYDTATGAQLWWNAYAGPGGGDWPLAIGVSPDGTKVFVTGESAGIDSGQDYATVAYDAASGTELWVARYVGPGQSTNWDVAYELAVSPDGRKLYVTGSSDGWSGAVLATLAYDTATGTALWLRRDASDYKPIGIGVSPDGSKVYVSGSSFVTVAYGASGGARLWTAVYDDGAPDTATAMGVSQDGTKVFVTGNSYPYPEDMMKYATVEFDAYAGTALWTAIYEGPGDSGAMALAVGPASKAVFVTGWSVGFGKTQGDYLTLDYQA